VFRLTTITRSASLYAAAPCLTCAAAWPSTSRSGRARSRSPGNVTLTEAVSLPADGTTSLTALRDKAGLRAEEPPLVRGASGGVGSVAVQLGRALGAHVTDLASARNLVSEAQPVRRVDRVEQGNLRPVVDAVHPRSEITAAHRVLEAGGVRGKHVMQLV
jgi:NADPH:quinone reductase-like Zn-dependent oxidoreductase